MRPTLLQLFVFQMRNITALNVAQTDLSFIEYHFGVNTYAEISPVGSLSSLPTALLDGQSFKRSYTTRVVVTRVQWRRLGVK